MILLYLACFVHIIFVRFIHTVVRLLNVGLFILISIRLGACTQLTHSLVDGHWESSGFGL